jgi:hypothetical protein
LDDEGAAMKVRVLRMIGLAVCAVVVSAHVGSPDVFFAGRAGAYDIRVVVRPPDVVPGVARVTVRAPADVRRVSIRPVFWRAGSRGAPSADETRQLVGESQAVEGSLWLMARGAYSVDVIVEGARGTANVLVPVASVATGRLAMSPALGALLAVLAFVLCAGLVNIVYKGAGESLLEPAAELDPTRARRARRAAAVAVPVLALAIFGGARWWRAVDTTYERTMYRPSPLNLKLEGDALRLQLTDTLRQPPGRPSALVPDHGKLMHLFLVRSDDARAFAHLHPAPADTSAVPAFNTRIPPLPAGTYHVFGDVVHETGFERTLIGLLSLGDSLSARPTGKRREAADPDDAWFVGDASRERITRLADGSTMTLDIVPNGLITAGREETMRITVRDPNGDLARLEPYLGMTAHGVVVRVDGAVYVHLHPMGTITNAAQQAFAARDRGDTTESGTLKLTHASHGTGAGGATASPRSDAAMSVTSATEFPYAFPKSGSYRLFVQVKRNGRVLTGAYAITVAETVDAP